MIKIRTNYIWEMQAITQHLVFSLLFYLFVVKFEVFTAVTMKNAVFWVPPKRQFLQGPHSVTSQKTAFLLFISYLIKDYVSSTDSVITKLCGI
jgi:hypothetical protein